MADPISLKSPDGVVPPNAVAELQGLYGPFAFSEKLLQKIWLRGDFDRSRATTLDGGRVEVLHAGRWNLLGGPDFIGARLRLAKAAPGFSAFATICSITSSAVSPDEV